jgi:hypothetical protein
LICPNTGSTTCFRNRRVFRSRHHRSSVASVGSAVRRFFRSRRSGA